MKKGETARCKQCLLFHNVFLSIILRVRKKEGLCGNGLKGRSYFISIRTYISSEFRATFKMLQSPIDT